MSARPALPWTLVALATAGVAVARLGHADSPSPSLPTSCSTGEIVVSAGSGRFDCVSPRQALGLDRCSAEEFVVADTSGRFACVRPSTTAWGVEALLPDCPTGHTLVSEGFGKWKCVDPLR
jgi:hypothetical protein